VAPCKYRLMAAVISFHRDVISCELARRGAWRDAAEACGSGEVRRVWAQVRGRCDLEPRSSAVLPVSCAVFRAKTRRMQLRQIAYSKHISSFASTSPHRSVTSDMQHGRKKDLLTYLLFSCLQPSFINWAG